MLSLWVVRWVYRTSYALDSVFAESEQAQAIR